jgi:uncharacterized membrane protein YczE
VFNQQPCRDPAIGKIPAHLHILTIKKRGIITMNKKVILKKTLVSLIGFATMAFGIAFSIKGALGTSPISSIPYVVGQISGLSVGTTTIILHCCFILLQILLLRKKYQIFQLSQLIVALVFGSLTDFALFVIQNVNANTYIAQWGLCAIGILLVGIGVSLEVEANFVMVAGEGLVVAICQTFHTKFGTTGRTGIPLLRSAL